MRGIKYLSIPTTILAIADQCIGGKTGVNHNDDFKNMIGSFYEPAAIFVCTQFLSTLDNRNFSNGFAEIFKMGFIYDKVIRNN
jgi:3-dehydroquinate synthetase